MNSYLFLSLIILFLGSLVLGFAGTWYRVSKLNKAQGIVAMFFPPLFLLFGALNFSQTKVPYVLLLVGFIGSAAFLGYTLLFEGTNAS